jgi:murein DD-endopeptidase MepM/ murein hydrolase activator NlpD
MIAPAKTAVTTPFGWVKDYPLNKGSYPGYGNAPTSRHGFHTGVDFSHSPDNKIYMPETGVVQLFNWNGTDYNGNHIIVQVGNRRHFLGHIKNNGFLVKNGTTVKIGTPIAIMGDTGYADGVHLHWGLRVDGKIVNGLNYVKETPIMLTEKQIIDLFRLAFNKEPTANQIKNYLTDGWLPLAMNVAGTLRNSLVAESAKVTSAAKRIKELEAALATPATELKPGKYVVK